MNLLLQICLQVGLNWSIINRVSPFLGMPKEDLTHIEKQNLGSGPASWQRCHPGQSLVELMLQALLERSLDCGL